MSQCDIRKMFGQGGGDSEKREAEKVQQSMQKRKMRQNMYDKTKRKRSAQDEWMQQYPWLEFENAEMFCGVCREFPSLCDKGSNIVKGITENYRKDTLRYHDKSEKHVICMNRKSALEHPGETSMAKSIVKSVEKSSEIFEKLFNTAYYIAIENEAFAKFPELLNLQSKNGVKIGENYKTDKACRQFCISCSEVLKGEVIENLKSARFFSILSDGSTDKGIREQELVYVRFVDKDGNVKTNLADVVQLEHGHAEGVKDGILKGLKTVGVDVENLSKKLVGINTDGAAVNLGKKGGAVKLLTETINENIGGEHNCESYMTVVHCVAHNLELAVCDTKKGCNYLDEFESVLKGIFKLYYYSPKRRRELYDIAVSLDKELKNYGGLQQIRWVARQNRALKSLLDNYEVTNIHLQEISQGKDENAMKAKGFLKVLTTERFLTFLHFMIDWTNILSDVSVLFQEKSCLISEVARRVLELKEKCAHMKIRRGKTLRKFMRDSENGSFCGVDISLQVDRRHNDTPELIKQDIDELLSSAEFFLEERFIKHIGGEPHSLFSIFDFTRWPNKDLDAAEFRQYGEEELERLFDMYCPRLISNEEKEAGIDEWLDLKLYVLRQPRKSVLEMYQNMIKSHDTEHLKNILLLVQVMLSISPTTAECERGFSQLNLIKTDKRTCLEYDSLAALLRIKIDGPSLQDFEPGQAIIHWKGYGPGSRHIHGHKQPVRPRQQAASHNNETDSESD